MSQDTLTSRQIPLEESFDVVVVEGAGGKRYSAFMPALALAAALVAAKIACVWPLTSGADLVSVLAISAEDVLVAMVFGVVAAAGLWLVEGRAALQRFVWGGVLVCGSLAALYAMVNVGVYRSMGRPLDITTLSLAKDYMQLRSSVLSHCSFGLVAGAVMAPLGYPLLVRRHRYMAEWRWRTKAVVIAAGVVWVISGGILWAHAAPDGRARRVGRNPHEALVASFLTRGLTDGRPEIGDGFPAAYLGDFRPAAERNRPPLAEFSSPPRNVIVVVLESVGTEYMSLYGSHYDTTPRLSAEAGHSLVFDRFYAHVGSTHCERMSLFYSVYPGLPWRYLPDGHHTMPAGLASILKQRGYRTAYFSASETEWGPLTYYTKDAGMDELFGPDQLGGKRVSSWGVEDRALVDGLIRWVDVDPKRPFFAMAWTDQTHDPYTLSADTQPLKLLGGVSLPNGERLERYLNAMRQVDRQLGRIFDALRERNLANDTLVVITGDHGEAFGELHQDNFSHGGSMYEENLCVPLMFWNPRLFPTGRRVQKVGGHVDLNPTLAHVLGIDPPANWQGASLFSDEHPGRAYLQSISAGYQFGETDGRYKYIYYVRDGVGRLYDLWLDPQEQQDVSAALPEVAAEMHARVLASVHAEEAYLQAAGP